MVDEGVGVLVVCVVVYRPQLSCPIAVPFDMIFYTTSGTAGINLTESLSFSLTRVWT